MRGLTLAGVIIFGTAFETHAVEPRSVAIMNQASQPGAIVKIQFDRGAGLQSVEIGLKERVAIFLTEPFEIFHVRRGPTSKQASRIRIDMSQSVEIHFDAVRKRGGTFEWLSRQFPKPVVKNSVGITMVPIRAGKFQMGSRYSAVVIAKDFNEQEKSFLDEHPIHTVRITKPFSISAHEITHAQFTKFVKATSYVTDAERDRKGGGSLNPKSEKDYDTKNSATWRKPGEEAPKPNFPVVMVSWNDAVAFCKWLSSRENETYRIPTEAEWEYCARGGTDSLYWNGDDADALVNIANVSNAAVAPVGSFPANPFGLHDVHGNVWEWCLDHYDPGYYQKSSKTDPVCRADTDRRVIRGGCFM